jgi:hypothetical protein
LAEEQGHAVEASRQNKEKGPSEVASARVGLLRRQTLGEKSCGSALKFWRHEKSSPGNRRVRWKDGKNENLGTLKEINVYFKHFFL